MRYGELQIPECVLSELRRMASSGDAGIEHCGFLVGQRVAETLHATRLVPVRNAAAAPGAFAIADAEVRRARRAAAARGESIVALVHTHPSGELALSRDDDSTRRFADLPWVTVVSRSNDAIEIQVFA